MTRQRIRFEPINLKSLNDLEWRLGEDRAVLRDLACRVNEHYHPFPYEKKLKPFQRNLPRKNRLIDNPSDELKRVQRKIVRSLLAPLAAPDFLYGAVRGRSIRENAVVHHGAKVVVKMDIRNYYPTLTNDHVYRIWRCELGCSRDVANLLTRLTTYQRRLPQGAPTSSALANIYLASVYTPVHEQCEELGVKRSAFVDDLIFSGAEARSVMEPTRRILARDGLSISSRKREVFGPRDAKLLTGIRLGRDGLRVPKAKAKDVRAGIHKLVIGIISPSDREDYIKRLDARISHLRSICERDGARFSTQLEKLKLCPEVTNRRIELSKVVETT